MMTEKRSRSAQGFTLIEIMIVFTLIGILVGLALPSYQHSRRKAAEAVLKEDLFTFRKLIDQYYTDKGKYPASLRTLVEDGYLRTIPVDPITGSADTWQEIREEPSYEDMVPNMEFGIIDVRSGSQTKALDGTTYDTW
ncbi:MAG: prepilin-type N-terminal cleavage/methylation domain-containing protein [Candidatus Aminicenantes bacterium]|nr:prepilin-type N-terminal cleavage/methylation domain-containing protein [Candidatus Aminicenantes bacterium]